MDAVDAAVDRLWPGRRATVVALDGGITNRNFKVTVDGSAYVLRMGGVRTELLGIDRAVEHAASLRAEEIGIGPAVVAFVQSEGWLVTRFIDGRRIPPGEMREPKELGRVAAALRKIHSAPAIPGRFDAHAVVDDYRAKAESFGARIPAEFEAARKVSERIRSARGPQPMVPCHNDLLNANFLDDGEVRIVDWEYAGMGDRFFDLANLSVNHEFSVADDQSLLSEYFGAQRERELAALRLMRFMSDFREAMWGVLQSGISELDFDFAGYAAQHFERMERTASEPDFGEYLRAAIEP
ncbi:MAG: phosphotransferase [Candidatus Dormiibacterota bacterium]